MRYLTQLLSSAHKKSAFDCGMELLDGYIHKQASQDVKRNLSACFVIVDESDNVKGYYTLSSAGIDKELIPADLQNKLPRSYNDLPVTLLGRLARDKKYAGEGLGEVLLLDALKRCHDASLNIGSMAVIVDPIDKKAESFYLRYGFVLLPGSGKMFISMKTISALF